MPYTSGKWVPEIGELIWDSRHNHTDDWSRKYQPWLFREGDTSGELRTLVPSEAAEQLSILGSDIGSLLRDGWLYWNLLERLKTSDLSDQPSAALDKTAGWVVDRMQHLAMSSASMPPTAGGPPPVTNSRPFRQVVDFLMGKLGEVKEFLARAMHAFRELMRQVAEKATTSVTVSVSSPWPSFQVGIAVDVDLSDVVRAALLEFQINIGKQFTVS